MKLSAQISFAGLLITFLFTRFAGLANFPIFSDEAIYIHWAQWIVDDFNNLFISTEAGKQPLFMWLTALFLPGFGDPVLAGRCVSILAGLATLAGILAITRHLFSNFTAQLAGWLAVFCPFLVFFDRLALGDSLLTACATWIFYLALKIASTPNPKTRAFIALGTLAGLAFLAKLPGLILLPICAFIFLQQNTWKTDGFTRKIAIATMTGFVWVLPYLLSIQNSAGASQDTLIPQPDYFLSFSQLASFPFSIWIRNFWVTLDFFWSYLTLPVLVVLLYMFGSALKNREPGTLALTVWALLPTCAIILIAKGFFSRYFLPAVPAFVILTARGIEQLARFTETVLEKYRGLSSKKFSTGATVALLLLVMSDGFFLPGN